VFGAVNVDYSRTGLTSDDRSGRGIPRVIAQDDGASCISVGHPREIGAAVDGLNGNGKKGRLRLS